MRRGRQPSAQAGSGSLTSLLDVMFILVFVLLVKAAATEGRTATAAPAPAATSPRPVEPLTSATVRAVARAALAARIEGAPSIVARVTPDGRLVALELADRRLALSVPMLATVADRDVGLVYLGDRGAELRLCHVIAREAGADLDGTIVAIVPEAAILELPVALVAGLRRDVERCLTEQRAFGVLVDPAEISTEGAKP